MDLLRRSARGGGRQQPRQPQDPDDSDESDGWDDSDVSTLDDSDSSRTTARDFSAANAAPVSPAYWEAKARAIQLESLSSESQASDMGQEIRSCG